MATLKDSKYFVYYSDRNITHLGYKIWMVSHKIFNIPFNKAANIYWVSLDTRTKHNIYSFFIKLMQRLAGSLGLSQSMYFSPDILAFG